MVRLWLAATGTLLGMAGLTGCFSSVRHVPRVQVQPQGTYKTATVEALEQILEQRAAGMKTLQMSVTVTATTGGERTGEEKTYTSFRGYIFLRKPADLRVILQLPVIGSKAMDMVSDGKTFTLLIPPRSMAYLGTNTVSKPSANGLENLRPAVFLDSLLVPGVSRDEYVTLTESTRIVEVARGRRPGVEEPDYALEVLSLQSGNALHRERVVLFSRATLLPFEQDVYNDEGQVVTRAVYEDYQPTEGGELEPRSILISRPLDQYSLRIDVAKLVINPPFDADEFEAPKIPSTFKVVRMQ